MKNLNLKAYFAELLGTFTLVLVGTGVAVLTGDPLYVAFAFGFVVVAMAYSIGSVSGAHLNPAVSLGAAIAKKISWKDFGFYALFQVVGALIASFVLSLVFESTAALAGNQLLNDNVVGALGIEIIITMIFVFVILSVTSNKEHGLVAGFVIALTLAVLILFSFNITTAGLNPARSIAPALLEGGKALEDVYVFIVGPLVGAGLGAVLFQVFHKEAE